MQTLPSDSFLPTLSHSTCLRPLSASSEARLHTSSRTCQLRDSMLRSGHSPSLAVYRNNASRGHRPYNAHRQNPRHALRNRRVYPLDLYAPSCHFRGHRHRPTQHILLSCPCRMRKHAQSSVAPSSPFNAPPFCFIQPLSVVPLCTATSLRVLFIGCAPLLKCLYCLLWRVRQQNIVPVLIHIGVIIVCLKSRT